MDQRPTASDRTSNSAISSRRLAEFEKAFHENRPRIYRFLLVSSHDPDLAEVLTQECFLKAFQNWSTFRGDAQVSTWLMRIAINLQKDHWRSRRIQFWHQTCNNSLDVDGVLQQVPDDHESPERSAVAKQQVARIWNTVSKLPHRQKTIFLLRIVEELTLKEIADVTGTPESTVKNYLCHCMSRIRRVLH